MKKNNTSKWDIRNMNSELIYPDCPHRFVMYFMRSKGCLSSLFTVHKVESFQGRKMTGENMTGEQYLIKNGVQDKPLY